MLRLDINGTFLNFGRKKDVLHDGCFFFSFNFKCLFKNKILGPNVFRLR